MKIEIEFESSYRASVTIDGKHGEIRACQWGWELTMPEGCEDRHDDTLAGMAMHKLLDVVPGVLQAWAAADDHQSPVGMWDQLTDAAADAASESMDRF